MTTAESNPSDTKLSVIFVLIYFLVLFLVLVFQLFFRFSFVLVFRSDMRPTNKAENDPGGSILDPLKEASVDTGRPTSTELQ